MLWNALCGVGGAIIEMQGAIIAHAEHEQFGKVKMATVPATVLRNGNVYKDRTAYYVKSGDAWVGTTWGDYAGAVRQAGQALLQLGVKPGGTTCILADNCPEWVIFDVATMAIAGVPAGIYSTSSPVECGYIVSHSEATVILVHNANQWAKIKSQWDDGKLPNLQHAVIIDGSSDDPRLLTWADFLGHSKNVAADRVDELVSQLKLEALGTLIYTSGTTGPPKAVMLSHQNMTWTAAQAADLVQYTSEDTNLSFLPLSHIAEQMFTIHIPAQRAAATYYCEGLPKLADNLKEVHPTIFFAVPRLWEKFFAALGARLPPELKGNPALLPEPHKAGMRAAIGLDKVKIAVSGAAPINRVILDFFAALGITIREVYGQSEDTGPTAFNRFDQTRLGSVGPVFPGIEVKIADDGEILVKGNNVFLGYLKNPEATAETLKDGWLYSGDLGKFDDDGYLFITGRKKDILITSGGKNITPINIETALKLHPFVGEAVVVGDARHYLTALLSLDLEVIAKVAADKGIPAAALAAAPPTLQSIADHVAKVNADLASAEQVKKYRILPRPLSLADNELTSTMKVKRANVYRNWLALIEEMYAEPAPQ